MRSDGGCRVATVRMVASELCEAHETGVPAIRRGNMSAYWGYPPSVSSKRENRQFRICVREFGGEGSWRDEKPLEDDDHHELYFFTRNDLGILTEVPRFLSQFTSSASAGATGTSHLIAYPHFWCASCERYPYEFTHPDISPNPKI